MSTEKEQAQIVDFYGVIITDIFMRFRFGKRNGFTSSQATEDRSTRWKKNPKPPKLSEITRHCIFSVLCPAFSNMCPLGKEEERMKWSPKDRNMLRAKLICIFALCSVTWTAGLTCSALFWIQLLASPDVWSCAMQIFKLFVSDCLEEVVVYKSEVKTVRKV